HARLKLGARVRSARAEPVLGVERTQAGIGRVEVSSAAGGVVDLDDGVPADFTLDGEVPGVHLRVVIGPRDSADAQPDKGHIAEQTAGRRGYVLRIGIFE